MWGLWWAKRHWGRFSPSTSVSPANHSTNFSSIIITRGWHNRPMVAAVRSGLNWTPAPTIPIKKIRCYGNQLTYTQTFILPLKVTLNVQTISTMESWGSIHRTGREASLLSRPSWIHISIAYIVYIQWNRLAILFIKRACLRLPAKLWYGHWP
jgi:hypothetical protein